MSDAEKKKRNFRDINEYTSCRKSSGSFASFWAFQLPLTVAGITQLNPCIVLSKCTSSGFRLSLQWPFCHLLALTKNFISTAIFFGFRYFHYLLLSAFFLEMGFVCCFGTVVINLWVKSFLHWLFLKFWLFKLVLSVLNISKPRRDFQLHFFSLQKENNYGLDLLIVQARNHYRKLKVGKENVLYHFHWEPRTYWVISEAIEK